ncbi:hypothetical protein [Stenotrophomonas indicatrix]|uniref:hypothetical protein n=1 Tax=Stenotrophomonas indicatrix TaxID=2045451 RepID=UPI00215B406B|nr:hypothetical protein [Stenotrophomonas indicatrix]MCR8715687.1 hypothetical protein [Stenotrophomonas indicatrix]
MNNAQQIRSTDRRPRRARLTALALGAVMSVATTSAHAGWPVLDYSNLMQAFYEYKNSLISYGADAAEYAEQAERWKKTMDQYTQALVKVQAQMRKIGLPDSQPLVPVPADYLVAETCGSKKGFSAGDLFKSLVFDPTGDVKQQQIQICVNIRMMQNRKYNDSVMFLAKSVPEMESGLKEIFNLRIFSNDQGNVQGSDSEATRMANNLEVAAQSWEGRMRSYDAYIEVMEANQKVVAQAALKGDPTKNFASDLVKTAALKTALSID